MSETEELLRVLLVESDVLVRHTVAEYLRECGYHVAEAAGLEEARHLLDSGKVRVDVLFSRGEVGFAAARLAREAFPDLDVVLSGNLAATAAKAHDLCEQGPEEDPPYDHQYLLEQIKRLTARRHGG